MLSIAPETEASRNRLLLWISILLAGIILYLALRGLDWQTFLATLRNASFVFLPIVFIWGSGNSFLRVLRWRVLLTAETDILALPVFWANMAGYWGNNISPVRAGELIRAAYVSRENKLSTSFALTTGLVERFMDLIALLIIGSVSLTLAGIFSEPLQNVLSGLSIVAVAGSVTLLLVPYFGDTLQAILSRLPLPRESLKEKLNNIAVPSTPGYIGVYQWVAMIVLQPFGVSNANALACIIFLQIIVAFWGTLAAWRTQSVNRLIIEE